MTSKQKRLKSARKQKIAIAHVFLDLKANRTTLPQVLRDPPACMSRVSVWTLLTRSPGLGEAGAKKTLLAARVWPEDRLGYLPLEARERVCAHLPDRAKGE